MNKFELVGMSEDSFWKMVKVANWPTDRYEKVKIRYLKLMNRETCHNFRNTVDNAYIFLDEAVGKSVSGTGDDGYSDLLSHIIGLGKKEFYRNIKNPKLAQKRVDASNYRESFSYCIPYDTDYGEDSSYTLDSVIRSAKKAIELIQGYRAMDDKTPKWLYMISDDLTYIETVMKDFVNSNSLGGLMYLTQQKKSIQDRCMHIYKFFKDNYLELPRKFTDNTDRGLPTIMINSVVSEASKVNEYLK